MTTAAPATTEVTTLIRALSDRIVDVLEQLAVLSDADLDAPCSHPCATAGTVRSLLTHNIDHERMHVGQVFTARYNQRKMQFSRADRIMAETLRARTELIASLIGLPDDALDAHMPQDQWTIRQMIEHTIYWERHSIDELAHTKLRGRVPADYDAAARVDVRDPDYGELPRHTPNTAG